MLELSKNPSAPYLAHPRGPHFTLLKDEHLTEDKDGEEAVELPLQKVVDYLDKHLDKDAIEAMALVTNNNGMALLHHKLHSGERHVQELFSANGPLVHPNGSIDLSLERLALVLVRNPFPTVRQHIHDFLKEMGLQPNMERLAAEFCVNCNKSTTGAMP